MALGCYVFFDMDDTLVEWVVSSQGAFIQVASEAGVEVTWEEASAKLREALDGFYHECLVRHCAAGPPDLREFWVDYDGRVLAALGVRGDLRHHASRVWDLLQDPAAIRLYREVPEVLETLTRQGARLGVITGRPLADPALERLGIRRYFDAIFDAFRTRGSKDRGAMFRLAAEAAAAAGRPAWHIGDSYRGDVLGARAAGLRPILLDRRGVHDGADCPRVSSLWEAVEIISHA